MKTVIIMLACIIAVYAGYRIYRIATLANGLDKLVSKGAIILDVRTEQEFASGHIEGAINMPLGEVRERYKELDPEKIYITTCSHGLRSVKVEGLLKERGFKHVYNGGAWPDLQNVIKKQ